MEYRLMWGMELAKTRHPGVFRHRDGRYLLRMRVRDPKTEKVIQIRELVEASNADGALKLLVERKEAIRGGGTQQEKPTTRFSKFVASVLASRIRDGTIKSAAGRSNWATIAEHIVGDRYDDTLGVSRRLGDVLLDQLTTGDLVAWREMVARRVEAWREQRAGGEVRQHALCVTTANSWIRKLRTVLRAAHDAELTSSNLAHRVKFFDDSDHDPYPREQPNSLTAEEAAHFLSEFRQRYPKHYAMVVLGFALGLRPSSLRPLRWRGPSSDIDWNQGILTIRRSHTIGDEVMLKTKTRTKDELGLTEPMLALLKWHTESFAREGTDLLFPGEEGAFLARSVLARPFRNVATALTLKKKISPRGMRRTHKDLMRRAAVDHVVAMAMSMHAPGGGGASPSRIHAHYSTVSLEEKREAVGAVARLIGLAGGSNTQSGSKPVRTEPLSDGPTAAAAPKARRFYEVDGVVKTLKGWAVTSGLNPTTLLYRIKSGLSMAEAIARGTGKHGSPLTTASGSPALQGPEQSGRISGHSGSAVA